MRTDPLEQAKRVAHASLALVVVATVLLSLAACYVPVPQQVQPTPPIAPEPAKPGPNRTNCVSARDTVDREVMARDGSRWMARGVLWFCVDSVLGRAAEPRIGN